MIWVVAGVLAVWGSYVLWTSVTMSLWRVADAPPLVLIPLYGVVSVAAAGGLAARFRDFHPRR